MKSPTPGWWAKRKQRKAEDAAKFDAYMEEPFRCTLQRAEFPQFPRTRAGRRAIAALKEADIAWVQYGPVYENRNERMAALMQLCQADDPLPHETSYRFRDEFGNEEPPDEWIDNLKL